MSEMTPREIVQELDKHIIGQAAAKRAVAIALRNRWRRAQVKDETLRTEITPKNILMIGPTGVGKTEIARRLARLANAPFIKVEATKFTEVGYVGRDVDSIIRDLMDMAVKMTRVQEMAKVRTVASDAAEDRILDILVTPAREMDFAVGETARPADGAARQMFRKKLREGLLDDQEIEVELSAPAMGVEIITPPGMEEMTNQLQSLFQNMGGRRARPRKLRIREARKLLTEEEAARLINEDDIKGAALARVEQHGIVFIDELDKIVGRNEGRGPDVSREGVQRDLLPLVEGCTVSTKYGMVKTDHILFIASGAFHLSKPSDLIPEMQGRLPIRVELDPLTAEDFVRILTEPDASLTEQYSALLATEGHALEYLPDGVRRIAEVALPRGVSLGFGQRFADLESLRSDERFAAVLAISFVFLLMGILFESWLLPLAVLACMPFAFTGAQWLLFATGTPRDIMAMVGMVILIGIVVNNGIVLVDAINRRRQAGQVRVDAICDAGRERLRPILMTALTTVGGLLPLALGQAQVAGISYTPLALTVIGGLMTSTALTLVVVPAAYVVLDDLGNLLLGTLRARLRPDRRSPRPDA